MYDTVAYCMESCCSEYIDCYNLPEDILNEECSFFLYERGELPEIEEIFERQLDEGNELGRYQILRIMYADSTEDYVYVDRN